MAITLSCGRKRKQPVLEVIQALIDCGGRESALVRDRKGNNALMIAFSCKFRDFLLDVKVIQALIEFYGEDAVTLSTSAYFRGEDFVSLRNKDDDEKNALILALEKNYPYEVIQVLVKALGEAGRIEDLFEECPPLHSYDDYGDY